MKKSQIPANILNSLRKGVVIPAMPLALNADRKFDLKHQRAVLRYYIDSGAGGIAVGVHSTQFEIRDPNVSLFETVLKFASKTIDDFKSKPIIKIAGVCGKTKQALYEADLAMSTGYHACLLSLGAMRDESIETIIEHCHKVADIAPIIGFYLQPAVGGRVLPFEFWREFTEIDNVLAIKIAPFNRYQTLDVIRAVCEVGRENEITLYTGNDDNIVLDLLTEFKFLTSKGLSTVRITGGLLGHWAVWTKKAVELLEEIHNLIDSGEKIDPKWLTLAWQITDCNSAFFDVKNNYSGCISGIHEVLRRQGIFEGTWCINSREQLSSGQAQEIDRVYSSYPELNDDDFVRSNIDKWLCD
jgi:dihydrodipicolinate synthase/N-acetylneuraminate lyase